MRIPELKGFSLVGGTALALKFGHRLSVDIDLFCSEKFDIGRLGALLAGHFGKDYVFEKTHSTIGLFCYIRQVKVDLVYYPHPIIGIPEIMEDIRLYPLEDISAMKINAILGRAAQKDFFDLAEILKATKLSQIMQWHQQKYPSQFLAISIPSAITYFTEAEESQTPVSLNGQTWTGVKKFIQAQVREYLS